ncbi:protein tonB [Luteimonas sp. FCS-9]|uniref:protein tonB n=1 Tax=Luteimonas sp. FCS-9 TaxID=1547516 RepID=UPI000A921E3A|nr:protein tonB [Luteimonas sp. FCS-9]
MVRRRFVVLLALLALCVPPAFAQTARQMRSEVEASMLVTGTVDIERDGRVSAHAIDQEDKLPPQVVSLVRRFVPEMRFEPLLVDGAPALARAKMSLRLVATPAGEGQMTIAIRSAHFGDETSTNDPGRVRSTKLRPPRYPSNVAAIGGKGTVYLLVQVAPDGSVRDAVAEQVNLTALGSARQMASIREALTNASLGVAKGWRFEPPADGTVPDSGYWIVRVPIDFSFGERERYGQWTGYHPGPRSKPAWAQPDPPSFSPDTLMAGGVHPAQTRFRLLTPLEG